jgi:hypothetical protein
MSQNDSQESLEFQLIVVAFISASDKDCMGCFAFLGIPSFHFLGLLCSGQLSAYVAIF